jgi:hypothetical protein
MRDEEVDDLISALRDDGFDPAEHDDLPDEDLPQGPPLQASELRDAHNSLSAWRSPSDFQTAVRALHRRTIRKVIFNNPRQKFLLDAWTLAKFAGREGVEKVRLAGPDDRFPDGYVRIAGERKNVEVTIADMPGRKMGDEYKIDDTGIEWDPVEDWVARADAIPGALEAAVARKIAKRYSAPVLLVIYLNLDEYGIRQQQTELVIAQVKQRYAHAFERLFILWKGKIY